MQAMQVCLPVVAGNTRHVCQNNFPFCVCQFAFMVGWCTVALMLAGYKLFCNIAHW